MTPDPTPKHKRCPHCGGGAEPVALPAERGVWPAVVIECQKCGARSCAKLKTDQAWENWDRRVARKTRVMSTTSK